MASIGDLISDTRNAARPNSTTVSVSRSAGGATLSCTSLTGWPTASAVHFVTYTIDTAGVPVAGTQCDWKGIVSGNSIGTLTLKDGTDTGNSVGDIVEMLPTSAWGQDLATAISAEHNRDGTHATITTDTINEHTSATGVTIDSALIKDGYVFGKGVLQATHFYTSSDTWSKPFGLSFIIVEVQGAGGGGGGGQGTGANGAAGAGGGAGGYSYKKIAVASLGSTVAVTVGAAGTGGAAGNNNGNDGTASSFGAHATAAQGTGGGGGASSGTDGISSATQGTGGTAASGDVNINGQLGGKGFRLGTAGFSGRGGNSILGIGGAEAASSADGNAGTGYGSGGSGGATNSATAKAGGDGKAGIVRVYEFY